MSESKPLNLRVEALGGLSAGVVGTVIGYPLDLVKTRMQTSSHGVGIFQLGRTILKEGQFPELLLWKFCNSDCMY